MIRTVAGALALVLIACLPAQARHYHHHGHHHARHHVQRHYAAHGHARHRAYVRRRKATNNESGASWRRSGLDLVTIATAANPITVARSAAERFRSLIADLVGKGFRGRIYCYAASGHIPGSLHHTGEACDFAQTGWDRTVAIMYRSTGLIASHGLRDGCTFRGRRDCGHVDTGRVRYARPVHHRRYARNY